MITAKETVKEPTLNTTHVTCRYVNFLLSGPVPKTGEKWADYLLIISKMKKRFLLNVVKYTVM